MKKLLLTIIFIAIYFIGNSQWTNLITYPTNERIVNVKCVSEHKVIIITGSGRFFKTDNDGQNWELLPVVSAGGVTFLVFDNNGIGYFQEVSTYNLYKSVDYGESWNIISQLPYLCYFMQIIDINTFVGISSSHLLRSDNGGLSWYNPLIYATQIYTFSFINSNEGWVGNKYLLKTTDGGFSYDTLSISGQNIIYPDYVYMKDSLHGWVFTHYPSLRGIFYTQDGGITWSKKSQIFDNVRDIHIINQDTIVMNSFEYNAQQAFIKVTKDAGATWEIINWGQNIVDMDCFGDSEIWLVGQQDFIERSTDFETFTSIGSGRLMFGITDVKILAYNRFAYCNEYGPYVMYTNDGGVSFKHLIPDQILNNDEFIKVEGYLDTIYILNTLGKVMKSINSGQSWEIIFNGDQSYNAVDFKLLNGNQVYVLVYQEAPINKTLLIKSSDFGNNWEIVEVADEVCNGMAISPNQHIFIKTHQTGNLYVSTDEGVTWSIKHIPEGYFGNMDFVNDSIGFLSYNGLYRTLDAGLSWDTIIPFNSNFVYKHFFHSLDKGIVFKWDGIYYTNDGGLNWEKTYDIEVLGSIDFPRVDFFDENFGIAIFFYSNDGKKDYKFLKTINGGQNWTPSLQKILELKIYPNPSTNILHFESQSRIGKIIIFDSAGRIVLNQSQNDEYQSDINIENLKPGIYSVFFIDNQGNFGQEKLIKQ